MEPLVPLNARPYVLLLLCALPLMADQVIMKDGTVYKGKIQLDTDKALLIGNPPFDPVSYMLETKDIEKIIYEEYRPAPPAERRRGAVAGLRLDGSAFSSDQLPLHPAMGLALEAGFRVHPLIELDGGLDWAPLSAKSGFAISDSQTPPNIRQYESFTRMRWTIGGRIYPFFQKKWKTEPYVTAGYVGSRLTPSGSGDTLTGSGWLVGIGAHHPLSTHWFVDGRVAYESIHYAHVDFLKQSGTLQPEIGQNACTAGIGLSYRF